MTFREHVVKVCERMKKRVNVFKALAGREWGWNRREMIAVYKVLVESCVWYVSSAWLPWVSKSYVELIERVQREGLRVCTGLKE